MYEYLFSNNLITVHGGWGNWKSVSVDHCTNEPQGMVKQIRYCENPTPKFGGDQCPEPEKNERFIPCNATNYEGTMCNYLFHFVSQFHSISGPSFKSVKC